MYKRIKQALGKPISGKVLSISSLRTFRRAVPISDKAEITEVDYPKVNMQKLPFPDNTFDFVISDQVLEHIEGDAQKAIDESYRVLKPGGIAIHTTVFMNLIHWGPKDMWRFSPDALKYLCRRFSEIIQCEGWGNRLAHIIFLIYNKSRDWQIPERKLSILHFLATRNNEKYPLLTWIIAKK